MTLLFISNFRIHILALSVLFIWWLFDILFLFLLLAINVKATETSNVSDSGPSLGKYSSGASYNSFKACLFALYYALLTIGLM